jgi:dTDP-4-dehydrorhamnose 3,5-epimerase
MTKLGTPRKQVSRCAPGFLVVIEQADFQYKVTTHSCPNYRRSLRWKDAFFSIGWPLPTGEMPILSAKDAAAQTFRSCDKFA